MGSLWFWLTAGGGQLMDRPSRIAASHRGQLNTVEVANGFTHAIASTRCRTRIGPVPTGTVSAVSMASSRTVRSMSAASSSSAWSPEPARSPASTIARPSVPSHAPRRHRCRSRHGVRSGARRPRPERGLHLVHRRPRGWRHAPLQPFRRTPAPAEPRVPPFPFPMGHRTVHRPDSPNREGKPGLDDQPRAHLDMRDRLVPLGDQAAFSQMPEWGHGSGCCWSTAAR